MKRWLVVLWGIAILGSAPAAATTVRYSTEAEMTQAAAAIVRGEVTQVRSYLHASGLIVTDVSIRVARGLKGAKAGSIVTLTQLGGELEGRRLVVPGSSTYRVGEEVVVFLERGGEGLVEMGVGAGKYVVRRDGSVPMVEREVGHVNFVRVDDKQKAHAVVPQPAAPEPLADFEERLLQQLGE